MSSDPSDAASPSDVLVNVRPVEIVVCLILLGIGIVLAIENWRIGVSWGKEGPQSGYFPFRLSLILIAASGWGLCSTLWRSGSDDTAFVQKQAFARVLKVLLPTVLYVVAIYTVGLYVASALLILVFMTWIGGSKILISLVTSIGFSLAIFLLFEVYFKVLLPKGPLEAWLGF
ncbi:MAG: tripartite tricarboxylate transporter TctB family protein [Hyphomicrobium aestuarii]|nr:tripartite tricarboxylate transporter TctB family protein [Hyphomicrobium aestuarii]